MTELTAKYPKESDYTVQSGGRYKTTIDNAISHLLRIGNNFAPHANIIFDFKPAGVSSANDTITSAFHNLLEDDVVQFTTTGTLPDGLSLATDYHVIATNLTDSVISVSGSQGGSIINIIDTGSGVHTATLTTGMTMRLSRGFLPVNNAIPTEVTVSETSTLSAPSANPRKDLVVIDDTTGALSIVTGAEAASPVDPTPTSDTLVIARINLVVSQTTIENSDIDDLRTLNLFPSGATASILANISQLQTNQAMNFFLDAVDHARSVQSLQDGFVDQFEDQTGVDDTNSVNESYDGSGDFYGPGSSFAAEWSTTSDGDWTGGVNGCMKVVIPASEITNNGSKIKVSIEAVAATNFTFDEVYIGHQAVSPTNVWDMDGGQVECLFGGSTGGEAIAGNSIESDEVTFALDNSKNVVLSFNFASDSAKDDVRYDTSYTGITSHFKAASNEAGTTAPTGFSTLSNQAVGFISLKTDSGSALDMTLIAESVTALSAPDDIHVALFKEDVDTLTINTDLLVWASRSKQTVTSDFATDDKLDATAHNLADDDRVIFTSSGADLPAGLDSETVYWVVNKTANDFEVSLTQSGAAVDVTDDGTGTHSVHAVTAVTLVDEGTYSSYDIYAGTADISGQPSDTDMMLFVQSKNNKDFKLHGQALQWS
jgi:hypothetical protein